MERPTGHSDSFTTVFVLGLGLGSFGRIERVLRSGEVAPSSRNCSLNNGALSPKAV